MLKQLNGTAQLPKISYTLCTSDLDYRKAYKFLAGTEFEDCALSYPTIMAVRDGKIEGVLGTHPRSDMLVAGPLYIQNKGLFKAPLEIRLVDIYETLLINLGVEVYVFYVKKDDKRRINMLRDVGLTPEWETEESVWYVRRF